MPVSLIVMLATYLMCWQAYKLRERFSGLGHVGILVSLVSTLLNSVTARISDAYSPGLLAYQDILSSTTSSSPARVWVCSCCGWPWKENPP